MEAAAVGAGKAACHGLSESTGTVGGSLDAIVVGDMPG